MEEGTISDTAVWKPAFILLFKKWGEKKGKKQIRVACKPLTLYEEVTSSQNCENKPLEQTDFCCHGTE